MRKPTAEECTANTVVNGLMAIWYPQMGGYVGMAWIDTFALDPDREYPCFEAYIYHDGDFPFHNDQEPVSLHHCMADQFIIFGEKVKKFMESK